MVGWLSIRPVNPLEAVDDQQEGGLRAEEERNTRD